MIRIPYLESRVLKHVLDQNHHRLLDEEIGSQDLYTELLNKNINLINFDNE